MNDFFTLRQPRLEIEIKELSKAYRKIKIPSFINWVFS